MIAKRRTNTLILLQSSALIEQWENSLNKFLIMNEELPEYTTPKGRVKKRKSVVGKLQGSHDSTTGIIDIAMVGSLCKNGKMHPRLKEYGMVILDECHHAASNTIVDILQEVNIIKEISDIYLGLSYTGKVMTNNEKSSKCMYFYSPTKNIRDALDSEDKYMLEKHPNDTYKVGDLVSKILDEYAYLPYSEREKIYCGDVLRDMNEKIKNEEIFAYQEKKDSKLEYLMPYKVLTSKIAPYNYVLFKTWLPNSKKGTVVKLTCKKLSKIDEKKIIDKKKIIKDNMPVPVDIYSDKCKITAEEKKIFEKKLKETDPMFIVRNNKKFEVRLTAKGIKDYNSKIHMRPIYTSIRDYPDCNDGSKIYTFNCSYSQINLYFFGFGSNAEIISPIRLRNDFKKHYEEAYKLYHTENNQN